ncbi:UDP-galactopyranose mutase, partial [Photobacterium sp. BZF1]|uniref:UDP-galactopyranose mutase n=1 Tax=Photobacterium sp. BZF1 TaxID=1904457 RepID=UPI0016539329
VHMYGAHIFHTSDKFVWDYVNQFVEFNSFVNSPIANYKGEIYNLPFNMNTFSQIWGVSTPSEAKKYLDNIKNKNSSCNPSNLEEQAISLVGEKIYRKLIKEYTEKQWGRECKELPAFIIKRLPVRFKYDNNYFNDKYQGIPNGGYTKLIEALINGADVELNVNYLKNKQSWDSKAKTVVYTGPIDEYFDYSEGHLEYRSLRFNERVLDIDDYQGNAVVNYTSHDVEYTRIIEHKHFESADSEKTVVTEEYPENWTLGKERYYPVNDEANMKIYKRYRMLSLKEDKVIFGGRLAEYKYYDMHQVIKSSLLSVRHFLDGNS